MAISEVGAGLDRAELRSALAVANIPTLVPILFQLTGDEKWCGEPYRPTKARGTDDHDDGGLPREIQQEIREAAEDAVMSWASGRPPAHPAPRGDELMRLLKLCVAENVPPEYEPMSAEEMGFSHPTVHRVKSTREFSVLIIGSGISGMTASKQLHDAGIKHTVIEKNARVGGTWIENRYPGCGVDTPSYLYSLSFFPRAWSTHFGKRHELEEYLDDLATHFDLRSSICFNTVAETATWDDEAKLWTVTIRGSDGERRELRGNALIMAVGSLNVPKIPDLPGMEDFEGEIFHSARWPDGLELAGKRTAVIGTGASAMQIVPAIADQVAALDVYQRSPQWVSPNNNYFRPVGDQVHWLMDNVPYYRSWYRFRLAWMFNDRIHASLQKDPDWPHPEQSLNAINDAHRRFFTAYIAEQLDGRPDLLEKALPTYPVFGKRMLLDNGWYASLKKPQVSLITSSVVGFTRTGVVTADGAERPADIAVLATGFDAHAPIKVRVTGRGGKVLQEIWGADDPRAYLGITTPGFPNLFFMYGPNTNLGHGGSFIYLAESQINYIVDALTTMVDSNIGAIECRPEVNDAYNARLDAAHDKMVWTHQGMDTWYRNSRGRVVTNMPWRVIDYWTMTRHVNLEDFIVTVNRPRVTERRGVMA